VGFFKSFFGRGSPSPVAVSDINFEKYFYLMNYEQHYAEVLSMMPDRNLAIAELYIFRGWTTQWGFRLFSPNKEIGDKVIYEVWNHGEFLGRIMMEAKYKITVPDASTVESRWQEYDEVFMRETTQEKPIPALQLATKAASLCGAPEIRPIYLLSMDLLSHVNEIKEEAIKLWRRA
jgi:hypothetical protein